MRKLSICLSVAVFFIFIPVAHAAIIGVVPNTQVQDLMSGKENSYSLYSLKGTTVTNLNTVIAKTNGSQVWGIGQIVYYNDTDGLYSQAIGSTTANRIRAQKSITGTLMLGKNWLISNSGKSDGGQSFFFNVQTKKVTKFTPAVKTIFAADATINKSTLAMIAKNGQGKQKLFLSTTSTNRLREFPLPTRAKSCDGLAIAPQGKTIIVGCAFTVAGSKTTQNGYAIYTRSGDDLKLVTRSVKNNSIAQLIWLDDQHVVALASMSTGSIEVHKWTIAKGKITADKKLFSNGTSSLSGRSFSYAPLQLASWTKNKFYFNMLYLYDDTPDTYLTFIDGYDVTTGLSEVIVDNSDFEVIF